MGGVGGKHAEVASPWSRWLLRLVRHFWVGVWTQVLANCLDRNQPPKAAQGAMIARAATCDQIAPLPSVLSNEIAAPSANTTATAKPWARGRSLASHAATYPPISANTAPYTILPTMNETGAA